MRISQLRIQIHATMQLRTQEDRREDQRRNMESFNGQSVSE
jgi:hypothetical protein